MARLTWVAATVLLSFASSVQDQMFGVGASSWSSSSGGAFSSSSSSSSSSGGTSSSSISQSQAGGSVSLQCLAPSTGTVVWFRRGAGGRRELARNSRLTVDEPRYRLQVRGNSQVLTIQPTRDSDSGVFECESTGTGGVSLHQFTLTIGGGHNGSAGGRAGAAAGFMGAMMMLM